MKRGKNTIHAGFIPLLDGAPLIAACEIGFAAREGLDLVLTKETSWATIRDRLSVGHLDVAHCLAPMPIAANLGLNPIPNPMIVPLTLGCGGNTLTVSEPLWRELTDHGAKPNFDAMTGVRAMEQVVDTRRARGAARLVFGIVHPHSAHHYELAYWLSVGGIVTGRDVDLLVVPPSLMPAALARGRIDGFCAGEPWGSVAVAEARGRILTTKAQIWRSGPEKVLAVNLAYATGENDQLSALLRAVYRACVWCDDPENLGELSALLAQPAYLGQPADLIRQVLNRRLPAPDGGTLVVEGFLNFSQGASTFPWKSQALWLYAQMVRWQQTKFASEDLEIVRQTYRPDLYRASLAPLGIAIPSADSKIEGMRTPVRDKEAAHSAAYAADLFFDGRIFDPDAIAEYIAGLSR